MTREEFLELCRRAKLEGRIDDNWINYVIFWEEFLSERGRTEMLIGLNNTSQGIVDGLPLGRTVVNQFQLEPMTDVTSGSYMTGNVVSVVAAWALLRKGGTLMLSSKIPQVAAFGNMLNQGVKINDSIFKARMFMETLRFTMFGYKYYKNKKRLDEGLITMDTFQSLVSKDSVMYTLAGTTWALPGVSGLWVAGGIMFFGNVMNEWKTDEVLANKRRR